MWCQARPQHCERRQHPGIAATATGPMCAHLVMYGGLSRQETLSRRCDVPEGRQP